MGDVLDGARIMENWNVVRLLPDKQPSDSSKQFGARAWIPLLRRKVQHYEHVEGGGQGKDVIKLPNMCQVKDLKRKLTGVRWKERGNGEIRQETSAPLPVGQL